MRHGHLITVVVSCIGLGGFGWMAHSCDRAASSALSEDARLAIEVRCQGRSERAARDCRAMLKKVYLTGSLDPDKTLRTYCDEIKNARWGGSLPPPPQLCVKRYGGWPQS